MSRFIGTILRELEAASQYTHPDIGIDQESIKICHDPPESIKRILTTLH